MSKKTIKQTKGVIEEYNDYRFKMLEVHSNFYKCKVMLTNYSREWFSMIIRQLCLSQRLSIAPLEYSEPQYEAFHAPVENSALSVAVNRAPQPHLSKQTEVNHGTVKPEISSASGWKSPEQKVASHSEKNGSLLSAMFETDQEQPQAASSPFTLPKLNE